MFVLMTYQLVALLAPGCLGRVVPFTTVGIIFTLGNKPAATLRTKSGVTLGDDRSLMMVDAVVKAEWNNYFIRLIA